jgi:peptidoglycan hydrolase CwlO-like protein
MKKCLVIVSVVALLLAVSTGVGLWKFSDAKAELVSIKAQLTDVEAQLTSMQAELTEIQEKLEENGGYWWEEESEYPWSGAADEEEETIWDLELRVEGLEWTVRDLEL